jgi:acetylornithine deacetylase/succinyl-diaminopimelate desuccinylase-like protein
MSREKALELARSGRERAQAAYFEELRIPSVSALADHAGDCRRCAEFLRERIAESGLQARLVEGTPPTGEGGGYPGHPTVYAEWLGAEGAPTLLVYGHYDVQPPDPLDEWRSPPFEPTVREGRVHARGAADSKANHMALIAAIDAAMRAGGGRLPVNLKLTIEGEEEGGGAVLPAFLRNERERLRPDCVMLLDGSFSRTDVPTMATATRGLVYAEVEITGAARDLHSGGYGGIAPNPLNTAGWMIAGLKSAGGQVLIPGFYDRVRPAAAEELAAWERVGITEEQMLAETGAPRLEGEVGQPMLVRRWARPTLDVHGIRGGFTAEGTKTVIPARAVLKVSMRLVPDQDPEDIFERFSKHVRSLATPGTRVEVRQLGPPAEPVLFGTDHPGARACASAFEKAWGVKTVFVRTGGTIPVGEDFARELGAPMIATGFNQPGSGAHSPNENQVLEAFHRGAEMLIHLFHDYAEIARAGRHISSSPSAARTSTPSRD